MKKLVFFFAIFAIVFLTYKLVYQDPRNWYDHYLHLGRSFLVGRVDVPNLPDYYQDTIKINGKTFLPFPPAPAVLIMPFLALNSQISQQFISIIIGAVAVSTTFILLAKFTEIKKAALLAVFLAFGTPFFWASVVGTTWYFAHVVGFLFLCLSLIFHFSKKDFLAGIFFASAVLCRYPILVGVIFFILQLRTERKRLLHFLTGAALLMPLHFLYAYLRFGNILETGYYQVYQSYVNSNIAYAFTKPFGYLDPRNIPSHIFTFLFMPPIVSPQFQLSPSPFGMGILFTSPLLLVSLIPNFKKRLELNLAIGASLIALVEFMHYAQGWVQFGYRFLIDFLPFLLILLAIRFRLTKIYIALLIISLVVSFWGVNKAINLGW